mgnify:CR=1 FL=1
MKKIIGKLDRLFFFGLIRLVYNKIVDYLELRSLKSYNYTYINHYNYKETILSKLCDKYGTDKGFDKIEKRIFYNNWHPHNYTDYYSSLFDHTRENIKKVFECGIGTNDPDLVSSMGKEYSPGSSLKMWRDYFVNSEIYGADIDSKILFQSERIKTFYVDQLDENSIKKMWNNINVNNFDLIIDDGLHTFEAGKCLFDNSFEKLRDGGIYIIEDVDPAYLSVLTNYLQTKNNIEVISLKSKNIKMLRDNNLIIIRK